MESEEIHARKPETTLIDRGEHAPRVESDDSSAIPASHLAEPAAEAHEAPVTDGAQRVAPWPESRYASFRIGGGREDDHGAEMRRRVRRRRRLRSVLRAFVVCTAAYLVIFNLSVVRGSSMAPGIHDGDRILVGQWTYLLGDVDRGDVVVMRYPVDPRLDYIKRVIGLPGDEIRMADGEVFVNGEQLDEPYVDFIEEDVNYYTRVREGHYFVLGDNRPHSSDSREFGQVARDLLKGRVDLRVWPLSRAGLIQ